jgi:hypothetical protein
VLRNEAREVVLGALEVAVRVEVQARPPELLDPVRSVCVCVCVGSVCVCCMFYN